MLERTILRNDKLHISSLLISLNETVSRYISGISIDAFIIGTLAYIGYSFIGLKYALVFAIFSIASKVLDISTKSDYTLSSTKSDLRSDLRCKIHL